MDWGECGTAPSRAMEEAEGVIPCRCPDPACFAEYHFARGRLKPDAGMLSRPTCRLADTAPQLPPARPEDYWPVSDEELAELQRRFEQANTPAARARHMKREIRRLLPRRTRLRLWWRKQLTAVGCMLLEHGHCQACEVLWRVTGLLSR